MPEIQTVLTQGGTALTDFTLHDSQHGFRVAERMAEIIAQDTLNGLSTYELTILLLSAYLHDIGMCPEQGRVIRHYTYLLTGKGNGLKDEEIERFRVWLDNLDEEVVIPLCTGTPSGETLRRAGWLIAQYCRERHVDWSVEWIDQKMAGKKLGSYMHWVDDLKAVCRSHHEGYDELISDRFEPKVVGAAAMVVHLRYLALVLRVADILEFNPERTPEVIFQHRQIDPRSVTYWYKDHYISRLIDDRRITISAEPPDARIHRAVEIMTNDIEAELELARRIDDEKPMEVCRFQEKRLCHRWVILPDVRRDIRPKNGLYEYIDGAFRPDTKKLLQLFSGKEMYGNELVAVRELLQNAFDAVREQIAYERLARPNPRDGNLEEKFAEVHKVELQVEVRNGQVWLV